MPSVNELEQSNEGLLRIIVMGEPKTKKTWWACAASEAGFNVLLLDGDDGWTIAKQLSAPAKKRIQVISLKEATKKAIFAPFITRILKQGHITWDLVANKNAQLQSNDNCVQIDLLSRTKNDVLIIDSWTALCWSLQFQYALENKIDLADAEKADWDFYGWGGRLATFFINQLKTLPMHVIIIGHKVMYEKWEGKGKARELIFAKEQISSTSHPHAMTMGGAFTDILSFRKLSDSVFKIDVQGSDSKMGGSRTVKPGSYNWDEFSFANLCTESGIELPPTDNPLWDISINQTTGDLQPQQIKNTVIDNKPGLRLNINK